MMITVLLSPLVRSSAALPDDEVVYCDTDSNLLTTLSILIELQLIFWVEMQLLLYSILLVYAGLFSWLLEIFTISNESEIWWTFFLLNLATGAYLMRFSVLTVCFIIDRSSCETCKQKLPNVCRDTTNVTLINNMKTHNNTCNYMFAGVNVIEMDPRVVYVRVLLELC